MRMVEVGGVGGIALDMTLASGQVFHWSRRGAGFVGTVGAEPVYVEERDGVLRCASRQRDLVADHFAMDHDLDAIGATFPDDPVMREAAAFCRGVRILRQPAFECLATFITSTQKRAAHIRAMSMALRERYGRPLGDGQWAYPDAGAIAAARAADVMACGLGYRAANLVAAARLVADGEVSLEGIRALDDAAARAALCRLPGVGRKVADCVLLFAYGRLGAFPVDVWIGRVLRERYLRRRRKVTPRVIEDFARRHFGPFGGYAQQYLFHHARRTWRRQASPPRREPRRREASIR